MPLTVTVILLLVWAAWSVEDLRLAVETHRTAAFASTAVVGPRLPDNQVHRQLVGAAAEAAISSHVPLTIAFTVPPVERSPVIDLFAHSDEADVRRLARAVDEQAGPARWTFWSAATDGAGRLRLNARLTLGTDISAARLPPESLTRTLFSDATTELVRPRSHIDKPPELTGVMGRLPDDGVAIMRTADGKIRTLRLGDHIDAWRLTAVAADRVWLVKGTTRALEILPAAS